MISVFAVAHYILEAVGPLTSMKLQKLAYYSQAWSLVWDEKPLFEERIEAWMNGPCIPKLFDFHKGKFTLNKDDFASFSADLSPEQKETVDSVLDFYGDKSAQWLSDLTHMELPWIEARKGLASNERGNHEITLAALHEYYSSIQ
jgi:uncharacterized phage-associated protein